MQSKPNESESRSEGFPRTRLTKRSCACDSGKGHCFCRRVLLSSFLPSFLPFFLSFFLSSFLPSFLPFFLSFFFLLLSPRFVLKNQDFSRKSSVLEEVLGARGAALGSRGEGGRAPRFVPQNHDFRRKNSVLGSRQEGDGSTKVQSCCPCKPWEPPSSFGRDAWCRSHSAKVGIRALWTIDRCSNKDPDPLCSTTGGALTDFVQCLVRSNPHGRQKSSLLAVALLDKHCHHHLPSHW